MQFLALQIHLTSQLVLEAWNSFKATVDLVINSLSEEQETQVEEYIEKAQAILEHARLPRERHVFDSRSMHHKRTRWFSEDFCFVCYTQKRSTQYLKLGQLNHLYLGDK